METLRASLTHLTHPVLALRFLEAALGLAEVAAGNRTLDEFETQQRAFVAKRVQAAKDGAALAMPTQAMGAAPKTTSKKRRS